MDLLKIVIIGISCWSLQLTAKPLAPDTFTKTTPIHMDNNLASTRKLLYFWASWCPDCREKLRTDLPRLQKEHNIDIVTVNLDQDLARGKHFIEQEQMMLPVIRDEEKVLRKQLSIFAVPAWGIVEQVAGQWEIVKAASGSNMEEIRDALLGGKK